MGSRMFGGQVERPEETITLSPLILFILAVTAGTTVANLYYTQPLLAFMADDLRVSRQTVSLLVTASISGYAVGLVFLVPLGDIVRRRRLIMSLLFVSGILLLVASDAQNFVILLVSLVFVGVFSAVAQVVVPFAAHLARGDQQGRVVGTVMAGLLVGILFARTASGYITHWFGTWRAVFVFGAIVSFMLSACFYVFVPAVSSVSKIPYLQLLSSVAQLIRDQPILRGRMLLGFFNLASFNLFWTATTFMLAEAYGFTPDIIGAFGLVGLVGALCAPFAGRLADAGHERVSYTIMWLCVLAGWVCTFMAETQLWLFIVGLIVFDFGTQGVQILNQNRIYALAPYARSRVTTAYITSIMIGTIGGATLAGVTFERQGWWGVCVIGAGMSVAALLIWSYFSRTREKKENIAAVMRQFTDLD